MWDILLRIYREARTWPVDLDWIGIDFTSGELYRHRSSRPSNTSPFLEVCIDTPPDESPPKVACVHVSETFQLRWVQYGDFSPEESVFITHYLPYALLALQAKKQQRAISIGHFAQTLDGKIATETGESRWIGNPENLTHAHRMRALCDG
ncbi:MAG: dihydrofolate reductase family protein, partial [Bacteroidota bacterium]